MRLSSIQQFGFAIAVFALGCASSLWLESSGKQNPFFPEGATLAAPVGLPSDGADLPALKEEVKRIEEALSEQSQ